MESVKDIKNRSLLIFFSSFVVFIIGQVITIYFYWLFLDRELNLYVNRFYFICFILSLVLAFLVFLLADSYSRAVNIAVYLTEELRQKNIRLKELEEFRRDFFSMVAHQLKTPITAIKWSIEAASDSKKIKEIKPILEEVGIQTQGINELINALLNISRIQSDRLSINPEKVDLLKLIKSNIKDQSIIAKAENKKIKLNSKIDKIELNIDVNIFNHIFNNLLSNAIKYSFEKGTISVEIIDNNDFIQVAVIDSGIGIPKEEQANLFSKFYRASNVKEISGTGLGLYLVKMLADFTKLNITFTSDPKIETKFKLQIPKSGMKKIKGEVSFS